MKTLIVIVVAVSMLTILSACNNIRNSSLAAGNSQINIPDNTESIEIVGAGISAKDGSKLYKVDSANLLRFYGNDPERMFTGNDFNNLVNKNSFDLFNELDLDQVINSQSRFERVDVKTTFGKPVSTSQFFSDANVACWLFVVPAKVKDTTYDVALAYSLVRVNSKVLAIYVLCTYNSQSDLDSAKSSAKQWAEDIVLAN